MRNKQPRKELLQAIAARIKALRKAAGLTQEELSERAEIATHYLSRLENAWQVPSVYTMVDLARALNVSPSSLMGEPEQDAQSERMKRMAALLDALTEEERAFIEAQVANWASLIKSLRPR